LSERTKMVYICNPNNPTSNAFQLGDILNIVENCNCMAVVDECYYEYNGETVADKVWEYQNLIVLRSFSKAFGLAGAKACYLVGHEDTVRCYQRVLSGFENNRFGVFGALAALGDVAYYKGVWEQVKAERDNAVGELRNIGLKVWDSKAAHIFLDVSSTGKTSTEIRDLFLERYKILIRDIGETFPELKDRYVSFAVSTPVINALLLGGFKDVVDQKI
ncbi:MAG: histidinol-phosphate aminotransferase family protein, partial [Candidatus Altiarchaeota archaeon]|nr:histidinol-phosphate aminotransferase family protein [Candidatus Altiarchaeota archaeon]